MDWQTFAVIVILALACVYLAGRARSSVRGFLGTGTGGGCQEGCGGCGSGPAPGGGPPAAPVRIRPLRDRGTARGR